MTNVPDAELSRLMAQLGSIESDIKGGFYQDALDMVKDARKVLDQIGDDEVLYDGLGRIGLTWAREVCAILIGSNPWEGQVINLDRVHVVVTAEVEDK